MVILMELLHGFWWGKAGGHSHVLDTLGTVGLVGFIPFIL